MMPSRKAAASADLSKDRIESEHTRWDPKDGELSARKGEARGNSGGGSKRY